MAEARFATALGPLPVRALVQRRLVFQGIRRTIGSALDQKNAAITAEVRAMAETLSATSLIGVRDRALLLVGFASAFRRSPEIRRKFWHNEAPRPCAQLRAGPLLIGKLILEPKSRQPSS